MRRKASNIPLFSEKHIENRIISLQWIMSEKYNKLNVQVKNNYCKRAWASCHMVLAFIEG